MSASFWRSLARDAHKVSKYSGDLAAFESGGLPRLGKRVLRREATRRGFGLLRGWFR